MTKKLKHGGKVIGRHERKSIIMQFVDGAYGCIIYKKNKKVFPSKSCGPLCIFKSRYAACAFVDFYINQNYDYKIVSCTYKPSKETLIYYLDSFKCIVKRSALALPTGTALAEFITCKE